MLFYRPAPSTTAVPHAPARASAPTSAGYAVVDLETTGLSPARDQILEIGLVLTDARGAVERAWSTLVRPPAGPDGRIDVGPTWVHGLTPEDLTQAPALEDVADLLVADLAGRPVVAHNARFDLGFLTQALTTRGYLARGARVPRVCTMEWARHFLTTPSRRLTTCCQVAGIDVGNHHSALDDARAAAGLLGRYLSIGDERGQSVPWAAAVADARTFTAWRWDAASARTQARLLHPR